MRRLPSTLRIFAAENCPSSGVPFGVFAKLEIDGDWNAVAIAKDAAFSGCIGAVRRAVDAGDG